MDTTIYYRVDVVFPDGHIEEINNHFTKAADAVEFGNGMLIQISNNERFHGGDAFEERHDPYFLVVEMDGKKRRLVYDSRGSY